MQGVNWLVPVGANPARPQDLDFQMVDADLVRRQMDGAGTRLNLMLLDACRNNPFANRGLRAIQGGLAEMRAPEGTLISYATQPGSVAVEGLGANSPYTSALAAGMQRPGQDIFRMFNQVGLQVKRQTGGNQQPWVSTSPIDGDFTFTPVASVAAAAPVRPPEPAASTATPASRSTPAEPVPPVAQTNPATRLADDARAQPCSLLDARVKADGTPEITGMALPGPGLDRLLRQAGAPRALRPADPAIEVLPPSACGPLAALGDSVRRTRASVGRIIRLTNGQPEAGGGLALLLQGAAGRSVALDAYRSGGAVQHLTVQPLEQGTDLRLSLTLPGPPGRLVLAALAGPPTPGVAGRPGTEPAGVYLAVLRPVIAASPGLWADLAVLDVRPVAVPPRVALPPAARPQRASVPAAPRPARFNGCGGILERAQLGEALSDADRVTLRTGCR